MTIHLAKGIETLKTDTQDPVFSLDVAHSRTRSQTLI